MLTAFTKVVILYQSTEAATGNCKVEQLLKQNSVIIATVEDVLQKLHDSCSHLSMAYVGKQL